MNIYTVSAIDDNNIWVAGGTNPIVLKSTNGGSGWMNSTGTGIISGFFAVNIFAVDNQNVFICGYTGNFDNTYVFKTTNGGVSWLQVFYQAGGFINALWMKNSNEGIFIGDPIFNVTNYYTIQKTSNGGLNWYAGGSILGSSGEAGKEKCLSVVGDNVWFGSNSLGKIYYSSNFGSTWNTQNAPSFTQGVTRISFQNALTGMCGGFGSLAITTNGGLNWNSIAYPGTGYVNGLSGTASSWICTKYGKSVYLTSNSGNNWTLEYQIPDSSVRNDMTKSRAGSLLWDVRTMGKVGKRIAPVGVLQISSSIPLAYKLEQNYPNPFNPETKIRFDIIKPGLVRLSVYDVNGKLISILIEENLVPGKYEISYNAGNLPTGVYFYKMQSGEYSSTKKMIIIK